MFQLFAFVRLGSINILNRNLNPDFPYIMRTISKYRHIILLDKKVSLCTFPKILNEASVMNYNLRSMYF